MHLISDPDELKKIYSYLPVSIEQAASMSREVLFNSCHSLRCDLDYFSVIDPNALGYMSTIVGEMKEYRYYILNCEPEQFKGAPTAFEITTMGVVAGKLWDDASYRDIYNVSGRIAIVSPSAEWVIFAETDDYAFFSSLDFRKFALFNARWWTHEYQHRVLPSILQDEHMKTWDWLYPKHKGDDPENADG